MWVFLFCVLFLQETDTVSWFLPFYFHVGQVQRFSSRLVDMIDIQYCIKVKIQRKRSPKGKTKKVYLRILEVCRIKNYDLISCQALCAHVKCFS